MNTYHPFQPLRGVTVRRERILPEKGEVMILRQPYKGLRSKGERVGDLRNFRVRKGCYNFFLFYLDM